jgi:hypothetical protein
MKDFIKVSTALFVLIMITNFQFTIGYEVVYAVNCGGDAQTGSNGIHFEADPGPCDNNDTQVVDHGIAGGLPYYDSVIFQHQRSHYNPFSYPIPVLGDGKYVLILKFFEPKQPPANIEDHRHICVTVNGIKIIYDLDISNEFGCSIPVEVHRVLWVKDGRLFYKTQNTGIKFHKMDVTISKIYNAHATLCGILFIRLDDENEVFPKKSWLAKPARKKYAGTCSKNVLDFLRNEIKNKQMYESNTAQDDKSMQQRPVAQDIQSDIQTTTFEEITTEQPTTVEEITTEQPTTVEEITTEQPTTTTVQEEPTTESTTICPCTPPASSNDANTDTTPP